VLRHHANSDSIIAEDKLLQCDNSLQELHQQCTKQHQALVDSILLSIQNSYKQAQLHLELEDKGELEEWVKKKLSKK
jgi:hypothetical protein